MSNVVPDSTQQLRLAQAAVRNAADKLQDAKSLVARSGWGSASALAALALEEIGKAMLCVSAFGNPAGAEQLLKGLTKHQAKLEAAVGLVASLQSTEGAAVMALLERAVDQATEIHQLRMRGLYVDSSDLDVIHTPADVAETDARTLISYLSTAVDALVSFTSDEAVAKLAELATDHADLFRKTMGTARQLIEVAPDQAMLHAKAMFRGEVPGAIDDQH